MSEASVRVIECGGKGYRRADVIGTHIGEIQKMPNDGPNTKPKDLIDFTLRDLPAKNTAIAYSLAALLDEEGNVVRAPNIPNLNGCALKKQTEARYSKPVLTANDMETAVTGMARIFPKEKYFMGMTWSTGIGMRICKNGEIVSSSEVSHIAIDRSPFAQLCGCGLRGCADALLGGAGVSKRIIAETQTRGINIQHDKHPCTVLDVAYIAQSAWAQSIYDQIINGMGMFLATVQTIVQVPAIIWKGSFAQISLRLPGIEARIRASMRVHLANPDWEENLKFHFVPMFPDVIEDSESFLGAAALAIKKYGL